MAGTGHQADGDLSLIADVNEHHSSIGIICGSDEPKHEQHAPRDIAEKRLIALIENSGIFSPIHCSDVFLRSR